MRLIKNLVLVFLTVIMINSFSGCYYDKEELLYSGRGATVNCATINAKFTVDIKPLMQSKCATSGCHESASAAGGVVLETYTQISSAASRINQRSVVEKTMPTSGPLSTTEVAILKCWIDSGAPNN